MLSLDDIPHHASLRGVFRVAALIVIIYVSAARESGVAFRECRFPLRWSGILSHRLALPQFRGSRRGRRFLGIRSPINVASHIGTLVSAVLEDTFKGDVGSSCGGHFLLSPVMRVLRPHGDVNYLYAKVTIKSIPSNKKVLFLYLHYQQLIISCLYTYNNLYEQRGNISLLVNLSTRQLPPKDISPRQLVSLSTRLLVNFG